MSGILDARSVTVTYGGVHANDHVDLAIDEGQFVGLIGANGAGKTTFVDAITGFAPVAEGQVDFAGENITRLAPEQRARRGLVRTFQSLELFDDLTVTDNLLVACEASRLAAMGHDIFRRRRPPEIDERVGWALETVGAVELADRLPEDLSHGQRKLVGIARALASRPRLVLLDEPAAGLDATESNALGTVLRGLLRENISVFLIDHDMSLVLSVCDFVFVLDFGRILAQGPPSAIRRDPTVIAAYLGDSSEQAELVLEGDGH